jgi:hypothetical protein
MLCIVCGYQILESETPVPVEGGHVHEHCADPEDVIAAGLYDPGEDYPHGDL